MDKNKERLIIELSLNKISKGDFLEQYPDNIVSTEKYIEEGLELSLQEKNGDDVELILLLGFKFGFPKKCSAILTKILPHSWHHSHEDIVTILGEMKDSEAACAIYQTAISSYDYLSYDDFSNLGKKCCSSLYSIKSPKSKMKLDMLSKSDDKIVANEARSFLEIWQK